MRHPAILFIHAYIRLQHVRFLLRIKQHAQWVLGKIGVPDPVVHIEITITFMYLVVISTVVPAILVNIHHAFVTTIEGCIEGPAPGIGASFYLDGSEFVRPHLLPLVFQGIKIPTGDFFLKVYSGLLCADEGDPVFKLEGLISH